MKKKYEIKNLDFNEISFIEQSLKKHITYYEDLNIKRPNDKLYINALKTVKSLCIKVKDIKNSKGEKAQVIFKTVGQKEFDSVKKFDALENKK